MNVNAKYFFSLLCFLQINAQEIKNNLSTKLLISLNEYGSLMTDIVFKNNLKEVKYINDAQFLSKVKYEFDPELLKAEVERAVPNKIDSAIVYIDLEGEYLDDIINKNINDDGFKKSLKLYIDVLKFVKELRPNAKWGYYYLPFSTYWERNSDFYEKHFKIKELIDKCDILFPSLYSFYEEKTNDWKKENKEYLKFNVENFIKIRKYYNKPIYVFVWHRYHNSNPNVGMRLVPKNIFQKQIKIIINSTFEHQKIDGIVWWGADNYSFRQKDRVIMQEFEGSEVEYKQYNDKKLYQYFKIIEKIIK